MLTVTLAGGGGGGAVGGGGSGARVTTNFSALPGENFSVWVAAGGAAHDASFFTSQIAFWAAAGGGASAMVSETGADIIAVAGGGGGGATSGSASSPGNGSDAGLPSALPAYWNGARQPAGSAALASPWGAGACFRSYCGQWIINGSANPTNQGLGNGGVPDFNYAEFGGAGGVGFTNSPVTPQPPMTFGWALGGSESYCDVSTSYGGGGGGGGGLFGGHGGSDDSTTGYPGTGGSSFSVFAATMTSALNGGRAFSPGGDGSAAVVCSGTELAPPSASGTWTAPGTYTWLPPAAGCVVNATASGGGGGGGWGAGGNAATVSTLQLVLPGQAVRVVVGSGGAGGGFDAQGAPLNFSAGSGGAASAVLLANVYEPVLVAAGGGGGATNGQPLGKARPCAGGNAGLPDARPAPCGGATGGSSQGAGFGAVSTVSSTLNGYSGAGQGGGPGYAWTGQNAPSVGYGAGGAGGIDDGSATIANPALSPPYAGNPAAPHPRGNQWGGGGGGGGGYFGGGGGTTINGNGGTPGAGGGSYYLDNQFTLFFSSYNGGRPGAAGRDGFVSIYCLANPPASQTASPLPVPPSTPAAIPVVAIAIGVAVPLVVCLFACIAAVVWAGGPRALAAKIAGDAFIKPIDGETLAARAAAKSGGDIVSVAMTREEALSLGVMTAASSLPGAVKQNAGGSKRRLDAKPKIGSFNAVSAGGSTVIVGARVKEPAQPPRELELASPAQHAQGGRDADEPRSAYAPQSVGQRDLPPPPPPPQW